MFNTHNTFDVKKILRRKLFVLLLYLSTQLLALPQTNTDSLLLTCSHFQSLARLQMYVGSNTTH